ncbi:MAG: diacylglycerol kinase family lipid kinase [Anaerolineales bacterium]|nr:diacylglycerol kinase family lipid kinase [Anaerolineales bacterium]
MKYFIIVNPISGRGLGEKSIPRIHEAMQGMDYKLVRTERAWHAKELAEAATLEGCDVIVSAGGDGTLNEAINGIMHARTKEKTPAFTVLSVGTGNDFSSGAGIPTTLEEGLQALKANKRRRIDLGFVKGGDYPDGRYFGNGIGVGFDAAVGFETLKIHWTRGLLAYLIGTVKTVFLFYNPPRLKITLDDETITQVTLMVSMMNGKRMGGGFKMAPESKSDDGLFDLCIVETVSKGRIFGLIPYFLGGTQATQPEVKMRRSRRVEIKALEGTFPAHADGETLCLNGSSLTLELLPLELEIICA